MEIVKLGKIHKDMDMNCQDAAGSVFVNDENGNEICVLKIICDGCSEGKHSEVGAWLFVQSVCDAYKRMYLSNMIKDNSLDTLMKSIMWSMTSNYADSIQEKKNLFSFTIVAVEYRPNTKEYIGYTCGDGYFIARSKTNSKNVSYTKIDSGEYPIYLLYNYIPEQYLRQYKDGVSITRYELSRHFNSDEFDVGVASDGLRFIADLPGDSDVRMEFERRLLKNREILVKTFINKYPNVFLDDISIVI